MKMNVRFTRDEYDHFIDIITGKIEYDERKDDCLGHITINAIDCELIVHAGYGDGTEPFENGKNSIVLDCNLYVLGRNTGYGSRMGIPYDYVDGFYVVIQDTYEETVNWIAREVDEIIKAFDLEEAVNRTDLTWDKLYRYEGGNVNE